MSIVYITVRRLSHNPDNPHKLAHSDTALFRKQVSESSYSDCDSGWIWRPQSLREDKFQGITTFAATIHFRPFTDECFTEFSSFMGFSAARRQNIVLSIHFSLVNHGRMLHSFTPFMRIHSQPREVLDPRRMGSPYCRVHGHQQCTVSVLARQVPSLRKLEKAVAVSGVCSGVLQENSGKVPGKLLENFSRIAKCYKF